MKIKFVAVIVTILSVVAAFQFAPGANADSQQPVAPGGLAVRQSGLGLLLSWDAVNGAESYNVYRDGQYTATVHPPVSSYLGADLQDAAYYVTACIGKDDTLKCSATSEAKANGTTWNLAKNTPTRYDGSTWPHRPIGASENKTGSEVSAEVDNEPASKYYSDAFPSTDELPPTIESVPGPTNLNGKAELDICTNNATVTLNWDAPEKSVEQYYVYKIDSDDESQMIGKTKLTSFSEEVRSGSSSTYEVRAYRRVVTNGDEPLTLGNRALHTFVISAASNQTTVRSDLWAGPPCGQGPSSFEAAFGELGKVAR